MKYSTILSLFFIFIISSQLPAYSKQINLVESSLNFYPYDKGWFDSSNEKGHKKPIEIKEAFELSDHISQEMWVEIMGLNPSHFPSEGGKCPKNEITIKAPDGNMIKICKNWPVTNITLYDLKDFIEKLNKSSLNYQYDIPDRWQYEYAGRGGHGSKNKDDAIFTGPYGSPVITKEEEFHSKIPWNHNHDAGPAIPIKTQTAYPDKNGAHDLYGYLFTWTKSKANSDTQELFGRTENWDLENYQQVQDGIIIPNLRVISGSFWFSEKKDLKSGSYLITNPDHKSWHHIGARLLRQLKNKVKN